MTVEMVNMRMRFPSRSSILLALLGVLCLLLAVLLGKNEPESQSGLRDSTPLPGAHSTGAEGSTAFSASRAAAGPDRLRLRMISATTGEALSGIRIRLVAVEEHLQEEGLSDLDGNFVAGLEFSSFSAPGGVQAKAQAPGFLTWEGECSPSPSVNVVELQPVGAIELHAFVNGSPMESERLQISVRREHGRGAVSVEKIVVGPGRARLEGLRAGRLYRLTIDPEGMGLQVLESTVAGWPEPTVVEVHLKPWIALAVELHGNLSEEDCRRMIVGIVGPHGEWGRSAIPEWDAGRGLAVAYPEFFGLESPPHIQVRGPLGLTLLDEYLDWPEGQGPAVLLQLERGLVPVEWPDGLEPTPSTRQIIYRGTGSQGMIELEGRSLSVLWTTATRERKINLAWASRVAEGVLFPRIEPVIFREPQAGRVRLIQATGVDSSRLSVVRALDGRSWAFEPEGSPGEFLADVPRGDYSVRVDGEVRGSAFVVRSQKTTVVSLRDLLNSASLGISLSPALTMDPSAEWQVEVFQRTSYRFQLLRVANFSALVSEGHLEGLKPGWVHVKVTLQGLGVSLTDAFLLDGQEVVVRPDTWVKSRKMAIRVSDASGAAVAGMDLKAWFLPRGTSTVWSGRTGPDGELTMEVLGASEFLVVSDWGMWVNELAADQTRLELSLAGGPRGGLQIECSGWWDDRVQWIYALCGGRGTLASFAQARSEPGSFVLKDSAETVALVVKSIDGSVAIVGVQPGESSVKLKAEPLHSDVVVTANGPGPPPVFFLPRLVEIGGIDVRGTMFESILGYRSPWGTPISIAHTVPVRLRVLGVAAHGGVVWNSGVIMVEPGSESSIQLYPISPENK